jgi:hypothetical protein
VLVRKFERFNMGRGTRSIVIPAVKPSSCFSELPFCLILGIDDGLDTMAREALTKVILEFLDKFLLIFS